MSVNIIRCALRASLIGALAIVSSLLVVSPAAADTTTYLRLAHLSPDTPEVDVYVASVADPGNATVVLRGVGYGVLSDYQILPGGQYTVSMRPAGADASTAPVIATTLDAANGSAYTVAGVGTFADLGLTVLDDDLTLPPAGQGRARVIQAAASQPQLDISVEGGMSLGQDVEFASTTAYNNIGAGEWVLQVAADSEVLATLPITVSAGSVYSVLILDTPTGVTVATRLDANSAGVVPAGGVDTGGGGLAASRQASTVDSPSAAGTPILAGVMALTGLVLLGVAGLALFRVKAAVAPRG